MKSFVSTLSLLFLTNFAFAQCTASFTWDDTDITIQFMDTSDPGPGDVIVSWFWDFDDNGNTSTQQNPTYTFSDADKYDVVLTITTQNGCTSSIEIEIETCVLDVSHTIGVCDASGNIPVDITINDPWDVAEEVDVILDGQSVPGSPFNISAGNPINITVDVPGDGLDHVIQCQSIEIATCGKVIEFMVEDCSSDCFLSGLQVGYPAGVTHTVDVGDDFFSPVSVGIVLGDIVNFDWIGDGHSTTSDATSGPDAWNSGVISIGSSFDVVIDNPGTHPYYCIPHGSTGGVGMAGEILANCPTGNSLDLVVSFNTTIADAAGYNIYYDGAIVPGSPFSYAGTGGQSQTISIAGDGLVHPLVVEDVNDPTCTLSMDYNSPDCDQGGGNPVCSISVSLGQPSGCDANQDVMVDATIIVANGGTGFNLTIDGGTPTFYTYNGPSTTVTLNLPGDGQSHTIAVTDEIDGACTANAQITTPDCNLPCSITNLMLSEAGATGGITHTVSVEDNIFNPSVVNITTGDLVEWVWNGAIAHTSTSDATSGPDSWDSGLLNQGATYTSPVLSEGEHPYYCVPHGNPGGVGMAGTIFVLPPCNAAGEVIVNVDFDVTSNGTSGYEVLVDGVVAGTFSYQGGSAQSASVNVIGDAMSHTIQVRDIDDNACTASADITTGDCDGGGTAMCSISATSSLGGGCDGNNQVPVDLVVTASDQGANFSVTVDGVSQGSFPYTGGTTNITINVDGDGQDHTIVLTDDVDAGCTTTTVINTPNCTLPCSITNLVVEEAGATGGITHTVSVEDNIFNPSVVNITTGDLVEWIWNGAIAHTSTSDATSGPDSWDSGLLNQGATYTSPVLSEGEHPYYCVPHGNPGGVGMAGTIFVLPPCNAAGEVIVNVDFDVTSNGTSGYEVIVDGVVAGTFTYQGGSAQSTSVNVIGDAMSHTIQVRDIDDNACTASADITTGDCDGGGTAMCSISATSSVGGGCDGNNQVPVDLVVTASDQGANFSVTVDGVSQGTFPYTGGTTNITINVDGDGQDHTIVLTDDVDAGCTTTTIINTPNCTLPCSITNLTVEEAGATGGITHTVSVEDNIFNPSVVNITTGDLVEWVWNGAIAHTSTSDATSGPDSWDSGLLNQGATYTSPVLSEGEHPYYCVPHGNPGGVGMAGTIFVLPPCNAAGEVIVNVDFDVTSNGTSGYEVLVDGVVAGTFSYQGGSAQSASVNVIGDAMSHTIQVRDIDDNACTASADITTGDCDGGGTAMCSISATSSLGGGCDGNNQVPVDLVVTASDQGANFSVNVDGVSQGLFPYTGGTTNITINVDGEGQDHTIVLTDDVDAGCTTTTVINTPNCTLPCNITNFVVEEAGATGGTTHTVSVEDNIFNPSVVNITTGDLVEWVWNGAIAHTSTSDATSGPDSWDSGLLNQGATYTSPVLSEGEHPYYCVPHGNPGGVGMAGTIFVLPPCNAAGEVVVNVNFDVTSSGASGFEILVDGVVAGTFTYQGGAAQSASVNVIGDAMSHTIQVRDIDDNACTASADITTGDCDGGGTAMCSISATSSLGGGCDGNNQVPVDLVVTASDQGANFSVTVDGVSQGTYPYTGSTTNITINVDGDGQDHTIVLTDDVNATCSTTTLVSTPDCTSGCEINDISLVFGENTTHIVKVEDFDFIPDSINIILGDTILFDWTGIIPHTATSDIQNGPNSFDSDLLSQGDTYELILTAVGDHPYYCVPHGAPGGIGMAGNISVSPSCDGEDALATISISSNGSSGQGFALALDGAVMPESPLSFDPSGVTTGSITVPGDSMSHVLVVSDVDNPSCIDSITFLAPLCEIDSCSTMISDVFFSDCDGANVLMTIDFNSFIGLEDHNVYFNGSLLNTTPITSNDQGLGTYSTSVAGLGEEVEIVVTNILTPTCTDTILVVTPDCNVPCLMSDVTVGSDAGIHIVEVRDFDFFPQDIEILIGDTVRFLWTGDIPHTATSDATTGVDVFDSGLFGEGHVFDVVINTIGDHPYYCIPHGGPGGIGMAGNITTIDTCDGDQWLTNYQFTVSAGSPLGYNIFIDGDLWNTTPIQYDNPVGMNSGVMSLPGDEMTHLVTFQDVETDFCAFTTSVTTGACGAGCTIENLTANVGAGVIHEVEVRDFDFLPLEITVRAGETVRFIWTGDIPHTSTSDALTGSDVWDSGLLSLGDTFDIVINTPGEHPYYCIPHGGPGGIGQSGVINVLPQCQDGTQEVNIRFDANGGSAEGYKLFVDGTLIGGLNAYDDPQGENEISVLLPADGLEHIVTIQDDDNPICAASAFYQSEDCATDCEIAGLMYDLVANKHTVEVRDFDYLPLDIVVEVGDTILFDWTGEIPHTVTSDATTGASQFNSGLLQEGDQWILILEEVGEHPYYCIPHGGPGGIGMAGNITVVDPCDDGEVTGHFTFTTSRLSGSYDVLLNGTVEVSGASYIGMPENTFTLQLPADNSELIIEIIDQSDSNCNTSITIPGINCDDPCFDVVADYTYDIDFATMEVDFTDVSNGNIVSWSWDFGDSNSSTETNPSHTYADPIVYDVCLTVVDDQDCESTFCDKVRFSDEVCIAGFTYEQNDLEFTFVNTSDYEDPDTEILWTFGDGDISMAVDSVDHTYDLGMYTVCIQISSDSCVANYCEMIDLSDPCLALSPDFSVTKDGESLTVEFSDLTSGTPDSWLWGFGDGNTSTEQNPSHTFDALGEYNICLFVQEETNSCSKTICKKIAVGTTNVTEIEDYKPLNIFPNPSLSLGEIYIDGFEFSDLGKEAQIKVTNSSGQLIQSVKEVLKSTHNISIEGAPGVYYISIKTNDNFYRAMGVRQ